jgi:glycosyltransferase involved in cell wall biosynthesis
MAKLSIVIPVYNSQESVGKVIDSLVAYLPTLIDAYEILLVEDDSRDDSWQVLQQKAQEHPHVYAFKLMRNYGQHNALLCGIRQANGDIIITMDDDGQHPQEAIPQLLATLEQGHDVVYASPKQERHGLFRDLASQVTKLVLQRAMGADTARNISAYRIFRTELREAFDHYQGPYVNIDVLLTWATKRFGMIRVQHHPREHGVSNYTFGKLVTHTFNMVTGFSTLPLQFASWLGFAMTAFGFVLMFYLIVVRIIIFGYDVPGFTFLATMVAIFAGAQMFTLGIIGEYLARMHFRLMDKPAYIVRIATADLHEAETTQSLDDVTDKTQNETTDHA